MTRNRRTGQSPFRGPIRQPGFGGDLGGRLEALDKALKTPVKGKTAVVDIERSTEFLALMSKASKAHALSAKENRRALELIRWLEKRREGMGQSLGDVAAAVQDVVQAARWLDVYDGRVVEDGPTDRVEMGHKRPSKQAGYVQPGRAKKVGVVVYLEPVTHQRLRRLASGANKSAAALVKQLIEDATRNSSDSGPV